MGRSDWVPAWRSASPKRPLKVRVLREAGGLGDVIVCLPALRWLYETFCRNGLTQRALEALQGIPVRPSDQPAIEASDLRVGDPCELVVYGFGPYRQIWDMAGVPFEWRSQQHRDPAGRRDRWINPDLHYKDDPQEFLLSIDYWCPFWTHEVDVRQGYPLLSRMQIACHSAGMTEDEIETPKMTPPAEAMDWAKQWLKFSGHGDEPVVLLFPLSQGRPRIWPSERWAEVARALWKEGARVIILADRPWQIAWWAREAPEFQRLCRTDWPRLTALMHLADLSLSGDTGPYHLAGACGTRTVGVFGLSSGEILSRHYPLARWIQGGLGRVIETASGEAHCRAPCYHRCQSGFGGEICYENCCASLLTIQPPEVIATAMEALAECRREKREACHV